MSEPEWKQYERQIFERLKAGVASDATVSFDSDGRQRLSGRFSKVDRQIDVIVRGTFAGMAEVQTMIVDCKLITRRLDVTHVESFAGLLDDVAAPLGLLVTARGFSEAARRRARSVRGIQIDVVPLDKLQLWVPRRPMVGITAGTDWATFTYTDDEGVLRTERVPAELARDILKQPGYHDLGENT